MTDGPYAVATSGLYKAFGSTAVLNGVDLTVPAASIAAILGTSGSGKTTLLRILAGLERPDAGSVAIGDTIVEDARTRVPAERRRLGFVSQEGSLFPHLDVQANVAFGLPRRQRTGRTVDELLALVDLQGFAHRYPHQLSGGQQQRVALARALATRPRVLLLDEPLASLDATLRATLRSELRAILRRTETTALLVTHDQDEALSVADLVAVLRKGAIAQIGTPSDLYDRPADPALASFVGEANLISGIAEAGSVATPFGSLRLRNSAADGVTEATVLLRPEQLVVVGDDYPGGVSAQVSSVDFYGHDATVRLAPEHPGLPSLLVARVPGRLRMAPGARVRIAARDPVEAWPTVQLKDQSGQLSVSSGPDG